MNLKNKKIYPIKYGQILLATEKRDEVSSA